MSIKRLLLFILPCSIALFACNERKSVPFPEGETEFAQPVSTPLQLSEPKKFDWIVTNTDTAKPPRVKQLNFDNLPSRPFHPDGLHSVDHPVTESAFDIIKLPDSLLDINALPATPLRMKTSFVRPPVIVRAGLPKVKKTAAMGIFEFGEDQGLQSSFVNTMMQDSRGMMWIATDKGLSRFDGEYLEIYSFIDVIFTGSLTSVSKMIEDKQGRIWIETDSNVIYIFDRKTGTVSWFSILNRGFIVNNDNEMIMDSKGMVWICSISNGLFIIDPVKQTMRHLPFLRTADDINAKQLTEDSEGNIWVGSTKGVSIINPKDNKIRFLGADNGLLSDTITGMYMDDEKRIWVSTAARGADVIDMPERTIKHIGNAHGIKGVVNHFVEDDLKRMWMASDNGVYVLEPSLQKFKHIDEQKGLTNNGVKTIAKDNSGQMWVSTFAGLNIIDTKGLTPEYLKVQDGLTGTDIWSFLQDKNQRIWIGSREGIDIFYPEKQITRSVANELELKKGNGISYYFKDYTNGRILISAPGLGICVFDPVKNDITYITRAQGLQNIFPIFTLTDSKGRIWTGAFQHRGIEIIDLEKDSYKSLKNENGLIGGIVWCLMEDTKGRIWAAADSGINIINPEDKTIRHLMDGDRPRKDNGGSFLIDHEGKVWIGTREGILIVDEKNNLLKKVGTNEGLAAPDVYTLFLDKGIIYAGTGNGLTVFTPKAENISSDPKQFNWEVRSYGKDQGLIYTNFNADGMARINNKLWWGIEDKALTVTDVQAKDSSNSPTHITGVIIADHAQDFTDSKWLQQHLNATDTIRSINKDTFYVSGKLPLDSGWLQKNNVTWDSVAGDFNLPVNLVVPYSENFISFRFSGTRMNSRNKVRYRYILEGVDKNWSAITSNPFSENYRDIPAGNYTFKVSSTAMNGRWSEPAEFRFTVMLPWWRTWWAWLLYVTVFGLVVWAIVQYRSRWLKEENRRLEEMVTQRTNELSQSITNLKNTQSQLVQSEKMASLGELTAGIAHEIQNPLNFVNNFSEVNKELIDELKEGRKKDVRDYANEEEILQDLEHNLEKIAHHGKRADAIVKGMLQHSRKSSGQKEPVDINALADEYLRLSYHGLRAKDKFFNATMHSHLDKSIGAVNVTPQDIGRVLVNLFNNAFYVVSEKKKMNPQGYEPTVTLSTKLLNNKVEIRVKDNGNGIAQPVAEKIFQPFFTTKPPGEGTGLGLSLSYDIITKGHGGELKVESKEGEGAEFVITLPVK